MYMLYKKTPDGIGVNRYQHEKRISLCSGKDAYIPWLLNQRLKNVSTKRASPYAWHIAVVEALAEIGGEHEKTTIVIEPKDCKNSKSLYLYEVRDILSNAEDTSEMRLHLFPLVCKDEPKPEDRDSFTVAENKYWPDDPLLYVHDQLPTQPADKPRFWKDIPMHFLWEESEKTSHVLTMLPKPILMGKKFMT